MDDNVEEDEEDLPRMRCEEYNWSPPISFESVWPLLFLVSFAYMVHYTVQIHRQKVESRKLRCSQMSSKSPFHVCGMQFDALKSQSEKVDIKLLFLYEVFLGINLLRVAIHKIPWFEDSLVKSKGDSSSDLRPLLHWCRFERFLAFLLPTLQFWAMFRLLFSRLFCVFEVAPTLRFSDHFIRLSTAFVDYTVITLTLGLLSVSIFDSSACIRVWTPVDIPNEEYFNCSAEVSWSLSLWVGVSYPVMIATNVFTLVLFIRKFLQLTESLGNTHSSSRSLSGGIDDTTTTTHSKNDDGQRQQSQKQSEERKTRELKKEQRRKQRKLENTLSPVLRVMIKLTTLSVTAIISSFLILIVLSLMIWLPINVEFMMFLDYSINCLCLLLVFKWMNLEYQWMCTHRLCLVHSCIASSVDSGLLRKVLASSAGSSRQTRVTSNDFALSAHGNQLSADITINSSLGGSTEADFTAGWQTPTSQPSVPKALEP